jgi:hypothetical protein
MKLRRSEEEQFLEAVEVAEARTALQTAVSRLEGVLDKMEEHLREQANDN